MGRMFKALLGGGSVVGFGYLLMKYTTPTDEELINALSPELRKKYEEEKEIRREQNRLLRERIEQQAKSSDPLWKIERKDHMKDEMERERMIRQKVVQARIDNEVNAEKERMRQLAKEEEESR
ncbi:assembly factor Cbp4p [Trichomonascus vanleenenianus]|uniref:Cbp4p n=1 Tax=Trichomonascus vanleenenianus TaxID=2268995 RepID=UPI003ECAE3B0